MCLWFFYWRKQIDQVDLSCIFNMFVKSAEIFKRHWKNFSSNKNEQELKFKTGLEYFDNPQFFELKLFFSIASRNFSADFTNMFKVLERYAKPGCLRQ